MKNLLWLVSRRQLLSTDRSGGSGASSLKTLMEIEAAHPEQRSQEIPVPVAQTSAF